MAATTNTPQIPRGLRMAHNHAVYRVSMCLRVFKAEGRVYVKERGYARGWSGFMFRVAAEQLQSMREQFHYSFERLDGTLRAAGNIDD